MPCLLKVVSNISVWNGFLTIAHFPASSNLGRTLVCFLLWQCLVISFLCLFGLACLMKLCSLDFKMYAGLYLVLFWMIHRVSLWFVSKWNCANFACLQLCRPSCPMEHLKNWCVSPLQQGLCGKMAMRRLDGWRNVVAWRLSEGLSSLFMWWEVGGALPEAAVHGHWHVPLQVFHPGTPFLQWDLLQAPTCPPQAYLGWFLPHAPARWLLLKGKDNGWVPAAWGISGKSGT